MSEIPVLDLSILKVLISNKKYALDFIHQCNEKVFSPDLWRFAKTNIDYVRVYKNLPTKRILIDKLKSQKNDNLIGYFELIWDKLEHHQYDEKEFEYDLEKLKTRFSERLIHNLKDNLIKNNNDLKSNISEINTVLQNIKSINKTQSYEQNTLKDSISDFRERYVAKLADSNFGAGIPSGYSFLDYATGGLRGGELLLIGGESGAGKSLLLMNMGINIWMQGNTIEMTENFKQGYNVLYFSLEMPFDDMQERVMSRLAMVPQKGIRDAKLTKTHESNLGRAIKFIESYQNHFEIVDVPRGVSVDTIELVYNDVCSRGRKPDVVIIDYLNLMDAVGTNNDLDDWLKQEKISEAMHEFGRVHETVVLSAVQLNEYRPTNKVGESSIGMHRIGRSRGILRNANFAIQIEKRPLEEQFPDMSLHMIKSRRTELAKGKIHKDFSCSALLDNPINKEEEQQFIDADDISYLLEKKDKKEN
jgi:archaellum biogenesis ATPase FlaH